MTAPAAATTPAPARGAPRPATLVVGSPESFALAWLASLAALYALGEALARALPPDPPRPSGAALSAWARASLWPEPRERTVAVALLAAAGPILVVASMAAARARLGPPTRALVVAVVAGAVGALVALAVGSDAYATTGALVPVGAGHALLALASYGAAAWATSRGAPRTATPRTRAAITVVALALLALAVAPSRLVTASTLSDRYRDTEHLESILYSVTQARHGARCLVDYVPHYGCYAELLAPWFRVVPLSLASFSATCIVIQVAAYAGLLRVVSRETESLLSTLAAASLVTLPGWMAAPDVTADPYFQYGTLRVAVVSAAIVATHAFLRRAGPLRAFLVGAFAAGVAWVNVDAGAPCAIAWIALLGARWLARSAPERDRARELGMGVGGVAAACLAGVAWVVLRGGAPSALARLTTVHRLYFGAGFMLLPMPHPPHAWCAVVALHLAAVVVGLATFVRGRADARGQLVFFVGLVGLALFFYYQGRSIDVNLAVCSWTAGLELALVGEVAAARATARGPVSRWLAVVALGTSLFAGALAAGGIAQRLPRVPDAWRDRWRSSAAPGPAEHAVAFLRSTLQASPTARATRKVLVLSWHQAAYQAESDVSSPLPGPGLGEIVLASEAEAVASAIRTGAVDDVVIDANVSPEIARGLLVPTQPEIDRAYRAIARDSTTGLTWYHGRGADDPR